MKYLIEKDTNIIQINKFVEIVNESSDLKEEDPEHYFRIMKELLLLGYFTFEIGCTKARRYVQTPGSYDACVDYSDGEKAWMFQ